MSNKTVSHMESCLTCGLTNSGAIERNPEVELMAEKFIELAVKADDHKALYDLAKQNFGRVGLFTTCGKIPSGPNSLYALRRIRMAVKALTALQGILEPRANDEHHFD